MSAPEFQVGELVEVRFQGHVREVARNGQKTWVGVRYENGDYGLNVPLDARGITVERVGPVDWPPQAGDIWSDEAGDAEEWHALPVRFGSTDVILHLDSALAGLEPPGFIDSFPRARLVRRREAS